MFETYDSLRAAARRCRAAVSQSTDQEVIALFTAVADQYDLEAVALQAEQQNATTCFGWKSQMAA